jgi:hypothetical protein
MSHHEVLLSQIEKNEIYFLLVVFIDFYDLKDYFVDNFVIVKYTIVYCCIIILCTIVCT